MEWEKNGIKIFLTRSWQEHLYKWFLFSPAIDTIYSINNIQYTQSFYEHMKFSAKAFATHKLCL